MDSADYLWLSRLRTLVVFGCLDVFCEATPHVRTLTGHTDTVFGVEFVPDGHTLATTSADHTIRLWDLSNRDHPHQLGAPLTGHTDTVFGVEFAPDGHTLATGSYDQTARLWDLPHLEGFRGDAVREACLRAGGALDNPTWDQYAPGVNYQNTCANR